MRSQLLIIITILAVGTASVSAAAFYQSPNKRYALLGEPQDYTNLTSEESKVAGVETERVPLGFPKNIPIFTPSQTVSYASQLQNQQLTLKTSEPLLKVANFYNDLLQLNGWSKKSAGHYNGTQEFLFSRNNELLKVKISAPLGTEETIISLTYSQSTD